MLDAMLSDDRGPSKRFVVYAQETTDVAEKFQARSVTVEHRGLPPEAPPFVAIREGDRFVGAVSLDDLRTLLEPPIHRPDSIDGISEGYRALYEVLDDTVFLGLGRRRLLATSREFEDRALRVGRGTLRVSFQSLSAFESQVPVYRRLADETTLAIHIYGRPDWTPPPIERVTYHATTHDVVERHWILAFDGGGDDSHACALLARETEEGFTGRWSYDPAVVTDLLTALERVDG